MAEISTGIWFYFKKVGSFIEDTGLRSRIRRKTSNDGYRCMIRKIQEPHQSLTTNNHEQNEPTFVQNEKNHEPEFEYEEF